MFTIGAVVSTTVTVLVAVLPEAVSVPTLPEASVDV